MRNTYISRYIEQGRYFVVILEGRLGRAPPVPKEHWDHLCATVYCCKRVLGVTLKVLVRLQGSPGDDLDPACRTLGCLVQRKRGKKEVRGATQGIE